MTFTSDDSRITLSNLWIIEIFKNFEKQKGQYKNAWINFFPRKMGSRFTVEEAGYFDERPLIVTYLTQLISPLFWPLVAINIWFLPLVLLMTFVGIGSLYIHLPFKSGVCDYESKRWGYYLYDHEGFQGWQFVTLWGKYIKHHPFPWNLDWYRTSYRKTINGEKGPYWEHEFKHQRKDFWEDKWNDILIQGVFPYTYTLKSGEVQQVQATVKVREMEWRPRWMMWTSLFNKISRSIEVDFSNEVGEETGSWKGGCIGCSYELLPNETIYQCLKRMENERKF